MPCDKVRFSRSWQQFDLAGGKWKAATGGFQTVGRVRRSLPAARGSHRADPRTSRDLGLWGPLKNAAPLQVARLSPGSSCSGPTRNWPTRTPNNVLEAACMDEQ